MRLYSMPRLRMVKNINFFWDSKKIFLTYWKTVFWVTEHFCIKWTFWKNAFFCLKNAFFWQKWPDNVLVIKFNFKWGLFSLNLCHDAAFCSKWVFLLNFLFDGKVSWKMRFSGKRQHCEAKLKKIDPT